jgi:hypothetical protein
MPSPRAGLLALALTVCACGGGGGGGGGGAPAAQPTYFSFQVATAIVGQGSVNGGTPDGGAAGQNAAGFSQPSGHVAAVSTLFVADSSNDRVLGFNPVPTGLGAPATIVLGADDFVTPASGLAADRMSGPASCWISGGALFVADRNNGRVLVWSPLPPASSVPAVLVLGKTDLTAAVPTSGQNGLGFPNDVCVAANRVIVADTLNHRVLVWNGIPAANGANADLVLGQPDFATLTSGSSAVKMNQPSGVWSDGTRLVVADTVNNRVLVWTAFPSFNGQPADLVIGQPDLGSSAAGDGPQGLRLPRSAAYDGTQLFVADTGNHRVLLYVPFPTSSNPAAVRVLGQATFTNVTGNDDNQDNLLDAVPTARTMLGPRGVSTIGNQLFVTDTLNHRVLVFTGS